MTEAEKKKQKEFYKRYSAQLKVTKSIGRELRDQLDTQDKIDQTINKIFKVEELSLAAAASAKKLTEEKSDEQIKQAK